MQCSNQQSKSSTAHPVLEADEMIKSKQKLLPTSVCLSTMMAGEAHLWLCSVYRCMYHCHPHALSWATIGTSSHRSASYSSEALAGWASHLTASLRPRPAVRSRGIQTAQTLLPLPSHPWGAAQRPGQVLLERLKDEQRGFRRSHTRIFILTKHWFPMMGGQ